MGETRGDVPPSTLEAWKNKFRIALMAKYNISVKSLKDDREPEYPDVKLTPAPMDTVETPEELKKREAVNDKIIDKADKQYKETLKKWREKTFDGIIREEAENKTKSVLYMMLGDEGQKRFHARLPYANIADDPLADFWHQLGTVFTFERSVIIERVEFFSRRQ